MTALKTLLFLVLVPGTVAGLIPSLLMAGALGPLFDLGVARYVAVPCWIVGFGMLLWCMWDFVWTGHGTPAPLDPPTRLVARGLYHMVRNPMYVGVGTILCGHLLWFPTGWLLAYTGAILLAFHLFVVLYEEPVLTRQFGDQYRQYCQRVPRWIPKVTRT